MISQHLKGTIWSSMYTAMGIHQDIPLCDWMANIGLVFTLVAGSYTIYQPAPYGRYSDSRFGPTMSTKLAWIIQESPAFFVPIALALTTPSVQLLNSSNAIGISLFLVHYFNRTFIFPFSLDKAKPTPITTIFSAFFFCMYNGFLQGHHLINSYRIETSAFAESVGLAMFFGGMFINIKHDGILKELKRDATVDAEGNAEYKIPHGGLFEFISGANYFGEILEWWGLATYTGGYPQVAFAIFTSTFLGIRAIHHHFWYKEHFPDYPKDRKAIVPYLL